MAGAQSKHRGMNRSRIQWLVAIIAITANSRSPALQLTDGIYPAVAQNGEASAFAILSESSYDQRFTHDESDLHRTIVGANIAYGIASNLDVIVAGGDIVENDFDATAESGDGVALAFGLRGQVRAKEGWRTSLHIQYLYIDEDLGGRPATGNDLAFTIDQEINEVSVGMTSLYTWNAWSAFYGVDAWYSDIEMIRKNSSGESTDLDAKANGFVGFRFGAQWRGDNLFFKTDASLATDRALRLIIGTSF